MSRAAAYSLFLILVLVVAVFASRPTWEKYHETSAQRDEAVGQMMYAESQRASLLRSQVIYESSLGNEELARERGFLGAGEKPFPPLAEAQSSGSER